MFTFHAEELTKKKYRNELKYICSEGELLLLQERVKILCQPDPHAGSSGKYQIRSIYFDDSDNRYYYENENGIDPREKYRIRIYNSSNTHISLECKQKTRTMTHKESCPLTLEQYHMIVEGTLPLSAASSGLLAKFIAFQQQQNLQPKVVVAYERTPFVFPFGNVRITFDKNIGSTTDISSFFDSYLPVRPILPIGKQILEVKYDELLPNFLYDAMNLGELKQTAFSKYYLSRKYTV